MPPSQMPRPGPLCPPPRTASSSLLLAGEVHARRSRPPRPTHLRDERRASCRSFRCRPCVLRRRLASLGVISSPRNFARRSWMSVSFMDSSSSSDDASLVETCRHRTPAALGPALGERLKGVSHDRAGKAWPWRTARSGVSKPSVNEAWTGASRSRASVVRPDPPPTGQPGRGRRAAPATSPAVPARSRGARRKAASASAAVGAAGQQQLRAQAMELRVPPALARLPDRGQGLLHDVARPASASPARRCASASSAR